MEIIAIGLLILSLNPDGTVLYGGPAYVSEPISIEECLAEAYENNSKLEWAVGNMTIFCVPLVEQNTNPDTVEGTTA